MIEPLQARERHGRADYHPRDGTAAESRARRRPGVHPQVARLHRCDVIGIDAIDVSDLSAYRTVTLSVTPKVLGSPGCPT